MMRQVCGTGHWKSHRRQSKPGAYGSTHRPNPHGTNPTWQTYEHRLDAHTGTVPGPDAGQALHQVDEDRRVEKASRPVVLPVIRPEGRDRMEVTMEDDIFVVHSRQAEEQAQKLGAGGYDALDELQQRLRRMGLERAMRRAGARPGDTVKIGEVELVWHG